MQIYEIEQKIQELMPQLTLDVHMFLQEHSTLRFYSIGFDCNSEYAEILLCFNTEEAYQETLKHYQKNGGYQSEEEVQELRYNTGDWEYQGVASYTDFTVHEKVFMDFSYALMKAFMQTPCYDSIPKTDDFQPICLDHEDEIEEALMRSKQILEYIGE